MEQPFAFDQAAVMQAMALANAAASSSLLSEGLTELAPANQQQQPLAWVDDLGQVWPHEAGAQTHAHIKYLYTSDEVQRAMQASTGIIVVNTMPSYVVDTVTGVSPPPPQPMATAATAAAAARGRMAMMQTFMHPSGAAVRSE